MTRTKFCIRRESTFSRTSMPMPEVLHLCHLSSGLYLTAIIGVTVSFFEWVKNVSHMRFGRMTHRLDEARGKNLLSTFAEMTGREVPDNLAVPMVRGAPELELVRSGLEDTMRNAYNEIREVRLNGGPSVPDLRTAAYVVACEKIALAYRELGVGH